MFENRISKDAMQLAETDRERWGIDAQKLAPSDGHPDIAFVQAATDVARHHLTVATADFLSEVLKPRGPMFRVIENCPIDAKLPPPPTDGKRPAQKAGWISEAVLLGATHAIGLQPFTLLQEHQGEWPQQVAPMAGHESRNHSGNKEEFGPHADNAILIRPHRAELIALLGLLNALETQTWLTLIDDLLTELDRHSKHFISVMEDPANWRVPFPESFNMPPGLYSKPCPILTKGPHGEYEISLATYNVEPLTQDARLVLEIMKMLLVPPLARKVVIRPGTLLLFNNLRGLHSRGKISGPRWAQRIYLNRTLASLQQACGVDDSCRVFDVCKLGHK